MDTQSYPSYQKIGGIHECQTPECIAGRST
jgi:hypothetical protein